MTAWVKAGTREEVGIITDFVDPRSAISFYTFVVVLTHLRAFFLASLISTKNSWMLILTFHTLRPSAGTRVAISVSFFSFALLQ